MGVIAIFTSRSSGPDYTSVPMSYSTPGSPQSNESILVKPDIFDV